MRQKYSHAKKKKSLSLFSQYVLDFKYNWAHSNTTFKTILFFSTLQTYAVTAFFVPYLLNQVQKDVNRGSYWATLLRDFIICDLHWPNKEQVGATSFSLS